MPTNLTQCRLDYSNPSADDIARYGWSGPVKYIPRNATTQISFDGCQALCGTGSQLYPWGQQSSTITTWVLPVVGIILQAPFNSNAFWETVFSIARWIGSPVASLSYILWNIKVSGKCALIVDLALKYENKSDGENFLSIRDSFYLLITMNQYTMKDTVRQKKEAEGLLRIALFSKDLRLLKPGCKPEKVTYRTSLANTLTIQANGQPRLESKEELERLRQALARELRLKRRRGVVPVFISTLWFVFSLGLSIQAAFGFLGENAQAHDLALGLLLAWLPVLILSSIVDRNPVAANDILVKINALLDRVRESLMDDMVKQEYILTIADVDRDTMIDSVKATSEACPDLKDFFVEFAGQGRKRFHYGVAHPILTDIEQAYIAERGRNWLGNEPEARTHLVLGDRLGGLNWMDPRELWQVLSAIVIVGGTTLGAFCLSYFTPTVGVGCRSGGYFVFGLVSIVLLFTEMLCWWAYHASQRKKSVFAAVDRYFFKFVELGNVGWLAYITISQTTGLYNNCRCKSSLWFGGGGYMDFNNYDTASSDFVRYNWTIATTFSATIMAAAMAYIVTEWCLQSHLSTADVKSAAHGLWCTRLFRWLTSPFRDTMHYLIEGSYAVRRGISWFIHRFCCFCRRHTKQTDAVSAAGQASRQNRRSVRWTSKSVVRTAQSPPPSPNLSRLPSPPSRLPSPPPSPGPSRRDYDIELQDLNPSRPRASSDLPQPFTPSRSRASSGARLIRSSDERRRDPSISPSRSSGGRTSSGGEASSSRLPRARGDSRASPGRGSGGSDTLEVPGFNLAHYGSESV
jgi:hypothetical protein